MQYTAPQSQQYMAPQSQQYMTPYPQYVVPFSQPQRPYGPPKNNSNGVNAMILLFIMVIIWLVAFRKHGKLSEWSEYTKCSKDCGGGEQYRTRAYTAPAWGGSHDINKNKLTETQNCNKDICKIDGKMSVWKDEPNGGCQKSQTETTPITCGSGKKKQTRTYISPSNGGKGLDANSPERLLEFQWADCNLEPCTNSNGSFTDWIDSGNCMATNGGIVPKTCGEGGFQQQKRTYIKPKGTGLEDPYKTFLTQWVGCQKPITSCGNVTNGRCEEYVDDIAGCKCIDNTYQIKQTSKYYPPTNGGQPAPIGCTEDKIMYISCDSTKTDYTDRATPPSGSTPAAKCPSEALLVAFNTTSDLNCSSVKGKERTETLTGSYTFPVGKVHTTWVKTGFANNLANIKALSKNISGTYTHATTNDVVTFKRTNDTIPETYTISKIIPCTNVPYNTRDELNVIWKDHTKCNIDLNDDILGIVGSNYNELEYTQEIADVRAKFLAFTKTRLLSDKTANNVKLCSPGGFIKVTDADYYEASDILVAGLLFEKRSINDRILLINGNFRLDFNTGGNLALYNNTTLLWDAGTWGRGNSIGLQYDGNLIIFNSTGVPIWNSVSFGNDGARLKLTSEGVLQIINTTGGVIRRLAGDIRYYLMNTFYNASPNALFSDKKGRFFKYKWGEHDNGRLINEVITSENGKTESLGVFRGWGVSDNNFGWDVYETDLLNIEGYKTNDSGVKPRTNDDEVNINSGDNYNREDDRKNFYKDSKDGQIRKPPQLSGGSSKPNYIPGYIRISYVDGDGHWGYSYKFLVMDRGNSRNSQAFVLYQKYHDRATFANAIVVHHPDLIKKIKEYFNMPLTVPVA